MTQADAVLYELRGPVAWMTINRPNAHNCLGAAVRDGLFSGFRRFEDDSDAMVLVVTGAGEKAFCAGGDLKEMAAEGLDIPPPDYVPYLGRNVHATKPVIAAVNGIAYGGGFMLAQMADLCVAAEHARFGVTEARWGRGAPWAAPLPWIIGPRQAMEMLLTADPISAARAAELGFVNRVVPSDSLTATVQAMAEKIAGNAPLTVRAGKALVYASAEHGWREAFDVCDEIYAPVYTSADAKEGPRAFQEGRPPRWQGK